MLAVDFLGVMMMSTLMLGASVLCYTVAKGTMPAVLIGGTSTVLCLLAFWQLKQRAVLKTIDDCVAEAKFAIARHSPAV
eukprot:SAG31_NODE_3168_length_4593_cov_205.949933_1_plen_79_part_00